MHYNYKGAPTSPETIKRYATAAIILGGGGVLATSFLANSYSSNQQQSQVNYGTPIRHSGQQYYIPGDSKRVVYPSREACLQDVPWDMQAQCEPTSAYNRGDSSWYGPVFSGTSPGSYRPSATYPTEKADASNTGNQLPKVANTAGFGQNGKALTGTAGG